MSTLDCIMSEEQIKRDSLSVYIDPYIYNKYNNEDVEWDSQTLENTTWKEIYKTMEKILKAIKHRAYMLNRFEVWPMYGDYHVPLKVITEVELKKLLIEENNCNSIW